MKERIQELAKQATNYVDPTINGGVCWELDPQKFAQLIVRECADKAHEFIKADGAEFPKTSVAYRIKQHFGVEE